MKQIKVTNISPDEDVKELLGFLNTIPGFQCTSTEREYLIGWDEKKYRRYARHNGGRRRKFSGKTISFTEADSFRSLLEMQNQSEYTCNEVMQLRKEGMKAEDIACVLHVSRATYFRRLKEHQLCGDMNSDHRF